MSFDEEVQMLPGGTIVEFGCGSDPTSPTTVGIDLDRAALRSAPSSVTRIVGDVRAVPLANASADAVVARGLLHHLADLEAFVSGMCRVLRPGGVFLALDCAPLPADEFAEMTRQLHAAGHAGEPRNGIDPGNFAQLLGATGFDDVTVTPAGRPWTNATPPFTDRVFTSPAWTYRARRGS